MLKNIKINILIINFLFHLSYGRFNDINNHIRNGYTKNSYHQRYNQKETVVALFNPIAPLSMGPCRYIDGNRKQNRQCQRDIGLPEVIKEARRLAISHCQEEFRYDRWNCSIESRGRRNIFKKVYRETAFIHAITAAALTFSLARACSEGKMVRCKCAIENGQHYEQTKQKYHRRLSGNNNNMVKSTTTATETTTTTQSWRWGGCSDNVKHGKRMARSFLDLKPNGGDQISEILKHNSQIGIDLTLSTIEDKCKCHGVSGSCSTKTCWRKLSDFKTTAALLRDKYNQAMRQLEMSNVSSRKSISYHRKKNLIGSTSLLYLETSPTFCSTTHGRMCRDIENCAILCCGRGYSTRVIRSKEKCRCRFHRGKCCHVICDYCDKQENRYYCK